MASHPRRVTSPASRPPLPSTVLVANRGEIACRILRTLRHLQVPSVAVYSDADAGARHVVLADQAVRLGGPVVTESYLDIEAVLAAARTTGATAIHPGYGLLSENAAFAAACEAAGLAFIGPTPQQIHDFGLKHRARELAVAAGVPVCPGSDILPSVDAAVAAAARIGYPVLLKATAGGGGIGIRLCRDAGETRRNYDAAQRLATAHFGNAEVFIEKYVEHARHVEVQIFGDGDGHVVTLGERDCSLQRRRQKVIEEAPAVGLDADLLAALRTAARDLGRSVRFRSAGTVEFLVDVDVPAFYFLEVNARLQVEHCVTEEICGVDLVEWMIRLAAGDAAAMHAYDHRPRGHAIEARVYAEDPGREFRPCSGFLTHAAFPAGVRVETGIDSGVEITPFYDPLLAKIIVHGEDRAAAIERLRAALDVTEIGGIQTNLHYLRAIAAWPVFRQHAHHTRSLAAFEVDSLAVDVVHPGDVTTLQDYPGRQGYWDVGVPPSGAMDWLAFRVGNRILGNADGVAGLEITVRGPTLRFRCDTLVCLAGAPIAATLDGAPMPMWQPVRVPANAELALGTSPGPGVRSYLLVRGGFDIPLYLGSRATFVLGGFGGHCGRALRAGDILPLAAADGRQRWDDPLDAPASAQQEVTYTHDWELRVLDGPHAAPEFFTTGDMARFYAEPFEVHHHSARTGIRLIGPKPEWARRDGGEAGLHPSNIHDTAYSVGSIDYTGDLPVILGPDGPSLGGFVCPAVVVHADRWKLGQLRPGDRVRFVPVNARTAALLDDEQERWIATRTRPARATAIAHHTPQSGIIEQRRATSQTPEVTYRQSGDRHLLIEYGPMALDIVLRVRVQLLYAALQERVAAGRKGIVDLTPGVRSLQVHFDPRTLPRPALLGMLHEIEEALPRTSDVTLPTRVVHLPLSWDDPATQEAIRKYMRVVRANAPWCPSNIEFIRRINGLDSQDDVRRIVYDASYLVLGLGDVYLGAPVATPIDPRHRLVTTKYNPARTWTPENAVGIGGAYLCIYGMEGPGGYQFVGRTVPVWNTYQRWRSDRPWLLRFFDQIRFFPVTAEELLEYRDGVRAGRIDLRIEDSQFDLAAHQRFLQSIAASTELFQLRQRAAFAAERERWQALGEFEAVQDIAPDLPVPAAAALDIPAGCTGVSTPMGAQVWQVSVAPGQDVAAGQEVCVLSAMKTETQIVAPCAGRVERVLITEGDLVSAGALLAIIRPQA